MANVCKCEFELRPVPRLLPRKRWLQPVTSECFPRPFTSVYRKRGHNPENGCDIGDFRSESDGTPGGSEIICENETGRGVSRKYARTSSRVMESKHWARYCTRRVRAYLRTLRCLALAQTPPSRTDRITARSPRIADSGPHRQLETLLSWPGGA